MSNNFLTLIIQARMNSTRFPHKVISDLCGAPLIERILQRVKMVKKIGTFIVATTKRKDDDILVNIASSNEHIRNLSIKHIKKAILFCKETNSKLYTFHPGFVGDPLKANKSKKNYDFIWKQNGVRKSYKLAFNYMLNSLKTIVNFARKNHVRVALETEGSSKKKDNFGLMQKPEEYRKLFEYFTPKNLGINLNVGHLNLASKAFEFSKVKFVDDIEDYIVAIELSHNNGIQDEHLPIKKKAWYWPILERNKFVNIPKILEYRNCNIDKIKKSIEMLKKH